MNRCWLSGEIRGRARENKKGGIEFILRTFIREGTSEILVSIPCQLNTTVEELSAFLLQDATGSEVEFCGDIRTRQGRLFVKIDMNTFRISRLVQGGT